MQNFRIKLQAKSIDNQDLYVAVNDQTGAITLTQNKDEYTVWQSINKFVGGVDYEELLYNPASRRVICGPNDDAPVVGFLLENVAEGKKSGWNIFATEENNGEGYGAIQLKQNTKMNLNAQGDGPYEIGTSVLAWNWRDGRPNEMWALESVTVAV